MMAMLCVTAAWAETVTFVGGTDVGATSNQSADTMTKNGITISSTSAGLAYAEYRFYNGTITISSTVGKITNVKFTCTTESYATTLFNSDVNFGQLSRDGVYVTWSGASVDEFTIRNTAQTRVSQIEVTYTPASTSSVATPVISFLPSAPYQGDETTCTITCATEGASIQYSTDGETYQNYSAPFTLTETTTVYAKATLGDDVSAVAENTVNFTPITTVANIAALTQLTNGTVFRMTGSATVVYASTGGSYIYIKDDTGYTLLYNTQTGAESGYIISNIVGKVSVYNGLFEVINAEFDYQPNTIVVEPTLMAIPNITTDNMNQYVKIENVTITAPNNKNFFITDKDGHEIQGRLEITGITAPDDITATYTLTGFVGAYNSTVQFYPVEFTKIETPVEFGITVTPPEGTYTEPVTVTITATDANAVIKYTLNGGDEIIYTEPFTLNETTAVSVTATLGEEVATWTGTYTINIPVPVTLDGMIVFADREGGDNSAVLTDNTFMAVVEKGADYVQGASNIEKVYAGATGLKFSSSKDNGSMTLNLKNKWNATKISFIAKAWINSQGTADVAKLTVNNQEFDLTSDFALYEIPFETAQEIQNITFAATKRAYLKVINIEGQEIAPSNYTITLDNAPGNYTSNIVVKATVSELPEGAKLYYTFLPTGSTATAQEKEYKAGVKLFQSGTLTFVLRDAENAELATAGGEYTVPVFGDLNNDGKADVTDVNELVNIILGKLSMDVNN